jgi:hypothetical protein
MKVLSPRVHGYLDYAAVFLLLLAPTLFGFGGAAATLCYVLAAVQGGMSLLTAYPLGAAKVIPFTIHGVLESGAAVLMLAAPWLFGFSHYDAPRNFFLVSGVGLAVVIAVTNYRTATAPTQHVGPYGRWAEVNRLATGTPG